MADDISHLEKWLGQTQNQTEWANRSRLKKLEALYDGAPHWSKTHLPELAHWVYCQPIDFQSQIGPDGHSKRGDFIPPITLPRRMWVSSDVWFYEPLPLEQNLHRQSQITKIEPKTNHYGEALIFLTIQHNIKGEKEGFVKEDQHIVYRDFSDKPQKAGRVAVKEPHRAKSVCFDIGQTFRFSAISFNAHRIHYDRDFAREEGYPALVVHGPFLAFSLLNHYLFCQSEAKTPAPPIEFFHFRAERPLFENKTAFLCFLDKELWVENEDREILMSGHVR